MSLAVTGLVQMLTSERVLGYKNMEINTAAEPETSTKSTYNIPISQYKYQHYTSHQELLCKSLIPFYQPCTWNGQRRVCLSHTSYRKLVQYLQSLADTVSSSLHI